MRRLIRPDFVMLIFLALVLVAAALWFGPLWEKPVFARALPRPVPAGDHEIVWLNTATNGFTWERFVAAIRQLSSSGNALGLKIVADENAFPRQTTAVPELAVTAMGGKGKIWFRWYKLTGEAPTSDWIQVLAARKPPPLAILGGGNTDRAQALAHELSALKERLPAPPLMLLTTATADRVNRDSGGGGEDLMEIYPKRSFRFCFTNGQMAEAVTDFVWQRDDLRPDQQPIYSAWWDDDPYSADLFTSFHDLLGPERFENVDRPRKLRAALRVWASTAGMPLGGWLVPALEIDGQRKPPNSFWSMTIPFSVGTFNQPNPWEVHVASSLIDAYAQNPGQERPLLVLPANPQPAQRFLRALARTAPMEAGRFTVVTGDALDFNTVYRDRNLKWPVQDLPLNLVFFCHRNPVDPIAFEPDSIETSSSPPDPGARTSSGSQDLMLYRDIAESLVKAAYAGGALVQTSDELASNLRAAQLGDGRPLFDEKGNQPGKRGEYIVCLLPVRRGDWVAPEARLQVWKRDTDKHGRSQWLPVPIAGDPELMVSYTPRAAVAVPGVFP